MIAALDRRLPAHAALRTDARRKAGFRPPYASRAAQSLVAIAVRIASISAAAASWAIITDSGGVEAHWSSTRSASARRTTSRPTTTTSTARPAAASAAHSAACCEPQVRTALSVSVFSLDKQECRPLAVERDRQLVGKVPILRADRALVESARQHVLGDSRPGQRVHLLALGREPRGVRMFEHVVERQQPPQHDLGRGGPAMPDVFGPEHPIDSPRRDAAEPEPGAVPRLFDGVSAAPPHEAVGERRIGPADEGEVLGAEEHAAVQADQRQPSVRAASRISSARPHSGTRCSRFAFIRAAAIVHTRPAVSDLSPRRQPHLGRTAAAVSTGNWNASLTAGCAEPAARTVSFHATF